MPKKLKLEVKRSIVTSTSTLVANEKATTLSLQSSNDEIKKYFTAVLALSKSDNKFPVNLDEVYPLVYTRKGDAFRELKKNFIEGVDFYLCQNAKVVKASNLVNGIKYDCFLSVPCMEFFIARKVRPVFEVYRKVFHKTAKSLPKMAKATARRIETLEKELEFTKEQLKWTRWSERREIELKCSCFSYLVKTKQYSNWEEYRRTGIVKK